MDENPITKDELIEGILVMFKNDIIGADLSVQQIKKFATDTRIDWK